MKDGYIGKGNKLVNLKADYLYNNRYSLSPAKAFYKYVKGENGTVDFSDDDDMLRQYYAAYLVNNGRKALNDSTYQIGLGLGAIADYPIRERFSHPLRYTFGSASRGFINDNDTIKLFDKYDFNMDYDKINKQRKASGKKSYSMGPSELLETYFTRYPKSGYTAILKLTPEKRK